MVSVFSNYEYVVGESDENRFLEEVLLKPADVCEELHILSGYANSSMLKRHIDLLNVRLEKTGRNIRVHLVIGMVPKEGLSIVEHQGFKDIVKNNGNVQCSYLNSTCKPCHSKVYIWLKEGVAIEAFIGSANYSQNAFYNQIESLSLCNPQEAEEYFQSFISSSIYCNHDEVEDAVKIVSKKRFLKEMEKVVLGDKEGPEGSIVVLSLLSTRTGDVQKTAGLNWGQRDGREPNQAYIAIPRNIGKTEFFPPKKQVFSLMTDDGFVLQCVVQGNKEDDPVPKQLTTTNNNSEIGRYFRRRLGVKEGAPVTKEDLEKYGRDHVVIHKIGDGTYYMDFNKIRARSELIEPVLPKTN